MTETLELARAAAAGALLGALFFGGLWQTARHALVYKQPALWFVGSMLLRTAVTLYGFYVLARGSPAWLAVSLPGFVGAQLLTTRWARAARAAPVPSADEALDAP
jgi:F1F0 ATPase subunit 2